MRYQKLLLMKLLQAILFSKSMYYLIYSFQQHSPKKKMYLNIEGGVNIETFRLDFLFFLIV